MRLAAAVLACSALAQDPRALIEKSLQRDQRDDALARDYAYLETAIEQEWRGGARTKTESSTYEILSLYGQPYRRLVSRDGKPLPLTSQEKEQRKMDKLAAERAAESPAQRQGRLAKYAEERRRQRAFLDEIPQAYDFQMGGETTVNGLPVWIVDASPSKSFSPKDSRAKMLSKFKGRFFIGKTDNALLKLEAEAIDSVSFGLVLARLERGARFALEKTRVNNELWMPSRIKVFFDARLALLKKIRVDLQIDYSGFRKFQTASRLVDAVPLND